MRQGRSKGAPACFYSVVSSFFLRRARGVGSGFSVTGSRGGTTAFSDFLIAARRRGFGTTGAGSSTTTGVATGVGVSAAGSAASAAGFFLVRAGRARFGFTAVAGVSTGSVCAGSNDGVAAGAGVSASTRDTSAARDVSSSPLPPFATPTTFAFFGFGGRFLSAFSCLHYSWFLLF